MKRTLSNIAEFLFWSCIVLLFLSGFFQDLSSGETLFDLIRKHNASILFSATLTGYIIISYFSYADLPVSIILKYFKSVTTPQAQKPEDGATEKTAEQFLIDLVTESRNLTEQVLFKSNVFLFLGCLIAILGIFYYVTNVPKRLQYRELESSVVFIKIVVSYGPHLGVLFFAEFIAFFMLRQYRMLTEDFKFFDQIKRDRESNLAIFKIAAENQPNWEIQVNTSKYFPDYLKLNPNETNAVIESKKMAVTELDFFGKISALLKSLK